MFHQAKENNKLTAAVRDVVNVNVQIMRSWLSSLTLRFYQLLKRALLQYKVPINVFHVINPTVEPSRQKNVTLNSLLLALMIEEIKS